MTPCRVGAGESDDRGTTDESRITVFALTVAWAEEESDDRGTTDESRITVFALPFSLSQTDRVRRLYISLAPYRGKRGPQNIHQVRKIGTVSFDQIFLKHSSLL